MIPEVIGKVIPTRFKKPTDQEIVKRMLNDGNRFVVSVACSITDTIDAQWQDLDRTGSMRLIRAAKEDILPALAAGIWIGSGGKEKALMHMQNSGFGHAIDGWIFLESYDIPARAMVTWRGHNASDNSIPHQLIGGKTHSLTKVMLDKGSVFGSRDGKGFRKDLNKFLERADSGKRSIIRLSPAAFRKTYPMPEVSFRELDPGEWIRRQEEVAAVKGKPMPEVYKEAPISRVEAHAQVIEKHPDAVIVTGNGFDPRALYDRYHRELNFYQVAYMGSARSLAYAMALVNPHLSFVAMEGDENAAEGNSILHNMAEYYPPNMYSYILDNGRGVSVGAANSLPLLPDNYRYSRVIRTVPEQAGSFISRRLEDGIAAQYGVDDDMREMIARVGPLNFYLQRFMHMVSQETERRILSSEKQAARPDHTRLYLIS